MAVKKPKTVSALTQLTHEGLVVQSTSVNVQPVCTRHQRSLTLCHKHFLARIII